MTHQDKTHLGQIDEKNSDFKIPEIPPGSPKNFDVFLLVKNAISKG